LVVRGPTVTILVAVAANTFDLLALGVVIGMGVA